jgi:hypothetical protein
MRFKSVCLAVLATLFGCGNYSNEDIDFQLALPEQSEIEAKLPQALSNADSAEYFIKTHEAVAQFNGFLSHSIDLIEKVRGYTPTTRQGKRRIWGPFPHETHPAWLLRVVMDKSDIPDQPNLLGINYAVQLSRQGTFGWYDFLTGSYISSGSAREGRGEIHWWLGRGRNISFPVDAEGMAGLDEIHIQYDTQADPISVKLQLVNALGQSTRGISYDYLEYSDGSGTMTFDLELAAMPNLTTKIISRWHGSGAGRADVVVNLGNLTWISETDCWGIDSLATYVYRRENTPQVSLGDASTCIVSEP